MSWELISFILSSAQREKILKNLGKPTTPSRISKETGVTKAHTTRILKKFEEKGLVECKTPEKRKGKIYVLTKKGVDILDRLEKKIGSG